MASGSLVAQVLQQEKAKAEAWMRYAAIVLTVLAGLGVAAHLATAIWASNEFTQPESILSTHSTMFAHDGRLYRPLTDYPYTVNAYMPLFYLLEASLVRVGVPLPLGGRLISFVALLGIFILAWKLVFLYTENRYCAYLASLLCSSTSLLLLWGTTGQVDTLAVFFSLTAFYFFSRQWIAQDGNLILTALFALGGLLVKQTEIAAPIAIFAMLLIESPKRAIRFGALVAGPLGVILLTLNILTHGGFLAHTIFANINPFAWEKLKQHVDYMLLFAAQLIFVGAICARRIWNTPARALLVYLSLAASVLALTAPKIGSDANYQIETTILLAITAAVGLHSVDFFPRFFTGDKALLTLLHLPLGIHMVLNLRLMYPVLLTRIGREVAFRQQILELRPLVGGGRVISADANSTLHLKGRIEVEPLIYTILVQGKQIDPETLRNDLTARKFSTIVLYTDVRQRGELDPEIPRLVESQNQAIRDQYDLVKHVPGPYMSGLFVYRPKTGEKP